MTTTTPQSISISCEDCPLQHSDACQGCLVTFVLGREPGDAIVVDVAEARAMRTLGGAGLVPEMRHPKMAADWAAC